MVTFNIFTCHYEEMITIDILPMNVDDIITFVTGSV